MKANLTKQILDQLQRKRKRAKLPPLKQDRFLQANAEKQAYELLSKRLGKMEREARERAWDLERRYFSDKEECVIDNETKIKIKSSVTHIGFFVIPRDLGGGAVLLTGRRSD